MTGINGLIDLFANGFSNGVCQLGVPSVLKKVGHVVGLIGKSFL
jgi:hypothetical protein